MWQNIRRTLGQPLTQQQLGGVAHALCQAPRLAQRAHAGLGNDGKFPDARPLAGGYVDAAYKTAQRFAKVTCYAAATNPLIGNGQATARRDVASCGALVMGAAHAGLASQAVLPRLAARPLLVAALVVLYPVREALRLANFTVALTLAGVAATLGVLAGLVHHALASCDTLTSAWLVRAEGRLARAAARAGAYAEVGTSLRAAFDARLAERLHDVAEDYLDRQLTARERTLVADYVASRLRELNPSPQVTPARAHPAAAARTATPRVRFAEAQGIQPPPASGIWARLASRVLGW